MVYMKLLERTPMRYDRGMRILTLGRIDRLKEEIAKSWVESGDEVLELGCGTGSLAALLLERGARVTGIDISEAMLDLARRRLPNAELFHLSATEIEKLGKGRFDRVVGTLVLSELSPEECRHVLLGAAAILKPQGCLVIVDEVRPRSLWRRTLSALVRWPVSLLTFVLTRSGTRVLPGLEGELRRAGFKLVHEERRLLDSLGLIVAKKEEVS